jgi:hypothetical protein
MAAKVTTTKTATRTKTKVNAANDWWDNLSSDKTEHYRASFADPTDPTDAELVAAYDADRGGSAGTTAGTAETTVADAVAAAHQAVANANARKQAQDNKSAEIADEQYTNAAAGVAADEAAKADAGNPVLALPDIDPKVPLTKEEQDVIAKARTAIATVSDPNMPPLTEEAQATLDDAAELPPATQQVPVPTPGASATNPALMRNDVDPTKTPPFGVGNRADLQG